MNVTYNRMFIILIIFMLSMYHYYIQNGLEKEFSQNYLHYDIKRPLINCNNKIYSRTLYENTIEYAKKNYMSSNYTISEFWFATTKYLEPFKKRDKKGIYFEFVNEEILLEHLKKIDEKYYKFIFEEGEI